MPLATPLESDTIQMLDYKAGTQLLLEWSVKLIGAIFLCCKRGRFYTQGSDYSEIISEISGVFPGMSIKIPVLNTGNTPVTNVPRGLYWVDLPQVDLSCLQKAADFAKVY